MSSPSAHEHTASVHAQVTLDVPLAQAFRIFTERFGEIKPRDHSLLAVPLDRTVFEPRVGGTVSDVGIDGSVCTWARVLVVEPPERLVMSWDITPEWELEPDPARTSEVEVRFTTEAPGRTRVELDHPHLDRHGDRWRELLGLAADDGWPLYLKRFRALV